MPTVPADHPHLSPLPRPSEAEPRRASTLPRPLTSFVGREREVAAVCALLRREDVRLVTLTGPGGVGKTRLAQTVAAEMEAAGRFADGVAFVPLAPIRDPSLVVPTIAQTLGVRDMGRQEIEERLRLVLQLRPLLLVLDNLEQVVAAAPQLANLLVTCPDLKVLATSRAVLRVSGERVVRVPPLSLSSEAVRLFVDRATAAQADFALTGANIAEVAAICARLDGLPLAIELAAAWVAVLSPTALLARLDRRLTLLTGGAVEHPQRLQTMRDAIAWSHDLLDPDEQALCHRLAVFVGGFTLEAAEAVGGETEGRRDSVPVLDGIRSLVDKSLLTTIEGPGALWANEPRYLMLETIREFALEQLAAGCPLGDKAEAVRRRHGRYFLRFAEAVTGPTAAVLLGPDPQLVIARVDAEFDNLRATLVWAEERGEIEVLLRLLPALDPYWALSGRMNEGRGWFDRALAAGADAPPALRAPALRGAAWVARDLGDYAGAEALAQASVALFREMGDPVLLGEALHLVGLAVEDRGDLARARGFQEQAFDLLIPLSEPFWTATIVSSLGRLARLRGDLATAKRHLEDALGRCRASNNLHVELGVLAELSEIALRRGDHAEAAAILVRRLEHGWDARRLPGTLDRLAGVARMRGEPALAARLLGAAEAARQRMGIVLAPTRQTEIAASVAAARTALGKTAFAAAWDEGRRMSPDDARVEAAKVARSAPPVAPNRPTDSGGYGLTPREREVLRLLAEGQSDREIAAALFISPKTVGAHVTNLLGKLGVPSRAAAVAYAHRHGLD